MPSTDELETQRRKYRTVMDRASKLSYLAGTSMEKAQAQEYTALARMNNADPTRPYMMLVKKSRRA